MSVDEVLLDYDDMDYQDSDSLNNYTLQTNSLEKTIHGRTISCMSPLNTQRTINTTENNNFLNSTTINESDFSSNDTTKNIVDNNETIHGTIDNFSVNVNEINKHKSQEYDKMPKNNFIKDELRNSEAINQTINQSFLSPSQENSFSFQVLNGKNVNISLFYKLKAILIDNGLLATRYNEEIINKNNVILKSAVNMFQGSQREYELLKVNDRKKKIKSFVAFIYNIYSLCVPNNFREEKNASSTFMLIVENFFNIKTKCQDLSNFQNIFYQRQRRINDSGKPQDVSLIKSYDNQILTHLRMFKKPLGMIEYLFNSSNEPIINYIKDKFEDLCELEKERLIRRKAYLVDFEEVRNSFKRITKFYNKNNLFSPYFTFEKILNNIFFKEELEIPIQIYSKATAITNGIYYRENMNNKYAFYIGINAIFEDVCLENILIKWIKFNSIAKSLQLFGSNRNLYHFLLYISKVPTRRILKGREVIKEEIIFLANKIAAK
uniref:Ras-GEF domain-containing protein n=1 Tax=Strongyloides venezuelensis TaxID=75913 RepID=A0A0K0FBX0_STRVS